MRILVAGGAGYIGSHAVVKLVERGYEPVIVDNFSNSSPGVIPRIEEIVGGPVDVFEVDLQDRQATLDVFDDVKPDAVMHFAGLKSVGESIQQPLGYYRNNLDSTLSLVEAMLEVGCQNLIFSSSATVYGTGPVPCQEDQAFLESNNPYGQTKVIIERMLTDIARTAGLRVALLRYFNPVGAHESGLIGEVPSGIPNNLMPYISQVAVGKLEQLTIFGDDYDTIDGTCLRDYIHVLDLVDGHVAALDRLFEGSVAVRAWNLGRGVGVSVKELVLAFENSTGQHVPYVVGPRREGDLAEVWADSTRAFEELGWKATRSVERMCADTWRWQSSNLEGYVDSSH